VEFFKDITIQATVTERFRKSLANGRLAHAYFFYGPEGSGKEAMALEIAKALNCQDKNYRPCNCCPPCKKINQLKHPDVKFVFPEAKNWKTEDIQKKYQLKAENHYSRIELTGSTSISIDKIRELKNEAKYTPYEADKKVYIVTESEKMTREGANSFLKLLEEPPDSLIIILINSSQNTMLDTIRSRCQIVYFPPLSLDEALSVISKFRDVTTEDRQNIQIAQRNLKQFFEIVDQDINEKRKMVYEFIRASAAGSVIKLQQIIDSITQRRDKNFLLDFLNLLILWFKDTIQIVAAEENSEIINLDFRDEIGRFAQNYMHSDFDQIVFEIEQSIVNVKSNIYAPLILTVLGIRVKKNLQRVNR
jgi:DNA polymerase-3 subunit delta'